MTTSAFDLACLLPPAAATANDMIVCLATSPQLKTDWTPSATGGAYVPAATAPNQIVVSGPVGTAYNAMQVPTDGNVYGRGANVWTACLPLAGGTISGALTVTGQLNVPTAPSVANSATNKNYVDNADAATVSALTLYVNNALGAIDCGEY